MNYKKKYLKYKLKYLNLNKNKLRGGYGDATPSDIKRTQELQLLGQHHAQLELRTRREQEALVAEQWAELEREALEAEQIDYSLIPYLITSAISLLYIVTSIMSVDRS
jgi:hypothetical protein